MRRYLAIIVLAISVTLTKGDTIKLKQQPDHIFKIEKFTYKNGAKIAQGDNAELEIKSFDWTISSHKEEGKDDLKVNDVSVSIKHGGEATIGKEWLFYKESDCYIFMDIHEKNSGASQTLQFSCGTIENAQMNFRFQLRDYFIYYSMKELPVESYYRVNYILDLSENLERAEEYNLKTKLEHNGQQYSWPMSKDEKFNIKGSGLVSFHNLYIPCIKDSDVSLSLRDSKDFKICSNVDIKYKYPFYGQINSQWFQQFIVLGKYESKGQINQGTYKVHQPSEIESNNIKKQFPAQTRAVKLESIVNTFQRGDGQESYDTISVTIYSDAYDQMFRCGKFNMNGGDAINFNGLEIPCKEAIAVTMRDEEAYADEGKTMLIPCSAQNQQLDLLLSGWDSRVDIMSMWKWSTRIVNMNNKNSLIESADFASTVGTLGVENYMDDIAFKGERSAFYQLTFTGLMDKEPKFALDTERFSQSLCGANVIKFKEAKYNSKNFDKKSPKLVMLSELFRQMSTVNKLTKVRTQIYSDYLDETISSNIYTFQDPTTIYDHENLFIPCKRELIIKLEDEDNGIKHSATLNCQDNGVKVVSFKIGNLYIVAKSTQKDGVDWVNNGDASPNKFRVKGVELVEKKDDVPLELFSLVTQVYDTKDVEEYYRDPQKAIEKPIQQKKTKELSVDETEAEPKMNGYLELGSLEIKKLSEENKGLEVFVRPDIERFQGYSLVFSGKGKLGKMELKDNHIKCNYALVLITTSKGQHTKFLSCNKELIKGRTYALKTFAPNLPASIKKILLAQDNSSLTRYILMKLENKSGAEIDDAMIKYGSFQKSMMQEVSTTEFDEDVFNDIQGSTRGNHDTINLHFRNSYYERQDFPKPLQKSSGVDLSIIFMVVLVLLILAVLIALKCMDRKKKGVSDMKETFLTGQK